MIREEEIDRLYGNLEGMRESGEVYVGDAVYSEDHDIPIGVVLKVNDDGTAVVNLSSSGSVVTVQMGEEEPPDCDNCKNQKVYSDKEEEWLCPFCEL